MLSPPPRLLLRPSIAKTVFTFDAAKIAVDALKFFPDVAHMCVDRVVVQLLVISSMVTFEDE